MEQLQSVLCEPRLTKLTKMRKAYCINPWRSAYLGALITYIAGMLMYSTADVSFKVGIGAGIVFYCLFVLMMGVTVWIIWFVATARKNHKEAVLTYNDMVRAELDLQKLIEYFNESIMEYIEKKYVDPPCAPQVMLTAQESYMIAKRDYIKSIIDHLEAAEYTYVIQKVSWFYRNL